MKVVVFTQGEASKAAETAQASDSYWTNPLPGMKRLGAYLILGPLPVQLPTTQTCTISILEVESEQALTTLLYGNALAGGTAAAIPALETPVGPEIAKTVEELKR